MQCSASSAKLNLMTSVLILKINNPEQENSCYTRHAPHTQAPQGINLGSLIMIKQSQNPVITDFEGEARSCSQNGEQRDCVVRCWESLTPLNWRLLRFLQYRWSAGLRLAESLTTSLWEHPAVAATPSLRKLGAKWQAVCVLGAPSTRDLSCLVVCAG